MRVAIIGCGFLGSAIGQRLVYLGHEVTGTTRSSEKTGEIGAMGIRPVVLSTQDEAALHSTVENQQAVLLSVAPRRPAPDYRSTYLLSARNLMRVVRRTTVSHIIYTGSTRVYSQDDGSWVDETSPAVPADGDGRVLLDTEKALLEGAASLKEERPVTVTVLRLGGIYGGARGRLDYVYALAGTCRSDGDSYINRIHVEDAVSVIEALLHTPYHGVLNVCDDHPQAKRSFYDAVLSAAGLTPIEWADPIESTCHGKRVRNELAKSVLGWRPKHPRRAV